MLHQQIKDNIKESMKAGDKVRLEVMRGLATAFMNELVATDRTPQEMLTDEQSLSVITRLAKQRKDSITQFKAGNRDDLVKKEEAELKILKTYLPSMMEKGEVEKIVRAKKEALGIVDPKEKGKLIAALMKDLKGKADGATVKEVVDSLVPY